QPSQNGPVGPAIDTVFRPSVVRQTLQTASQPAQNWWPPACRAVMILVPPPPELPPAMPAHRLFAPLVTLLAVGWLAAVAAASEFRETEQFADAVAAVESYAAQYGAENVWLVLDIDNTLLAMQS